MRRLVIILLILGGILVAGDFAARAYAESRVREVLMASLDLERQPDVALGGISFLFSLASGTVPSATVSATDVTIERVPVERMELLLQEVAFSPRELLRKSGAIHATTGDGSAVLSGEDVTAALRNNDIPVSVRFEAGRAFVSAEPLIGDVAANVSVEDGQIVLRPDVPLLGSLISVRLPPILPGVRYTSVTLENEQAALSFDLTDTTFEF